MLWQFVDTISATAVVRLDLNAGPLRIGDGFDLSPAPVRRTVATSTLTDGDLVTGWTYGNRSLVVPVQLITESVDDAAVALQLLARELVRDRNTLKVQLGSVPYFFRTFAAPDYVFSMLKTLAQVGRATLEIPAEPFAYGLKETSGLTVVINDPAEGTTLNSNPFFEVDALGWTALGGTFVRSTAQFHQGAASGLLTPDGVTVTVEARAASVPADVGVTYRASAWVRCAASRNVSVSINWRTAAGGFLSTSTLLVAVTLNTWTLIDLIATAPASTGLAELSVSMGATPLVGHTLHIDEAKLRGGVGGMCFDATAIKGDVASPLVLTIQDPELLVGTPPTINPKTVLAIRRVGTPANTPFLIQAESATLGTDASLPGNDTAMSGVGSNYVSVSFATAGGVWASRFVKLHPASASVDARGTYRVFARVRRSTAVGNIRVKIRADAGGYYSDLGEVLTALSTDRRLIDMGLLSLPFGPDPVADGYSETPIPVGGVSVQFWAQRDTGSSTLDIDYLLFVPADDRSTIVDWTSGSLGASDRLVIDGPRQVVYSLGVFNEVRSAGPNALLGGFPAVSPGVTNRVYLLRTVDVDGDDRLASTTLTYAYWPRYLFVKPVLT
jgi:hypothetical protein